jgi:undecaprenol kinase
MDSQDQSRKHPLYKSFYFALRGIAGFARTERNLRIHLCAAVMALTFGWFLEISSIEWLFILAAIAGTISLELVNTAIERTVDLATNEIHPLAKQAKDIAAGAVLIYAMFSVAVGLIIFLPKLGL